MVWDEPALFIAGLFFVSLAGVLLLMRVGAREDHVILTVAAGVETALLGARAVSYTHLTLPTILRV